VEGRDIRFLREELGWSKLRMATALGVSLSTVNNWEVERSKPSPMAKEKLKKLFVEQFRYLDGDSLEGDQDPSEALTGTETGSASSMGKNRKEIQLPLGFRDYLKPRYSIDPKL
jgi:DNA-binding XRE family transcriptional regulator